MKDSAFYLKWADAWLRCAKQLRADGRSSGFELFTAMRMLRHYHSAKKRELTLSGTTS